MKTNMVPSQHTILTVFSLVILCLLLLHCDYAINDIINKLDNRPDFMLDIQYDYGYNEDTGLNQFYVEVTAYPTDYWVRPRPAPSADKEPEVGYALMEWYRNASGAFEHYEFIADNYEDKYNFTLRQWIGTEADAINDPANYISPLPGVGYYYRAVIVNAKLVDSEEQDVTRAHYSAHASIVFHPDGRAELYPGK